MHALDTCMQRDRERPADVMCRTKSYIQSSKSQQRNFQANAHHRVAGRNLPANHTIKSKQDSIFGKAADTNATARLRYVLPSRTPPPHRHNKVTQTESGLPIIQESLSTEPRPPVGGLATLCRRIPPGPGKPGQCVGIGRGWLRSF